MHRAHRERSTLRLTSLTIVGLAVFLASAWLLPVVSEYSLVGDNISELVLGRFGVVQAVAFVLGGAGILALAVVLRDLTEPTYRSLIGTVMVGIYGLGAILVAFFPTERIDSPADVWSQALPGTIHIAVALVSFVSMVVGMILLSLAFGRDSRWRRLARWSGLLAGGALSLTFVQQEGPFVGLMQRLFVTVISAWLLLVAFGARSIASSGQAGTPSS